MNPETPKPRFRRWLTLLACLVADLPLLYLALVWNKLPGKIPMQYSLDLQTVNRYGSRTELLSLVAGLGLTGAALMLLFYFLPRFDPKQNLKTSRKALQMIGLGTCMLLAFVGIGVIRMAETNDPHLVVDLLPFPLLGLTALLGNYLTSIKPNYFAGFRTPWTLESETVWRKTHRFGGRLLFWGSLLALLPVWAVPGGLARMLLVVGFIVIISGYTLYYSYRVYRQEQTNPTQAA